jgi:hypothetical protein
MTKGSAPIAVPHTIQRSHASERAREHGQPAHETDRQIRELEAIDRAQYRREERSGDGASRERRNLRAPDQKRGQVQRGKQRPSRLALHPGLRPLGEHERKVHEERRQEQPRDDVSPVEEAIERVEAAAEREREHAEKSDRQPEEMQRGGIGRAPQPDRRADEQREHADAREHEIQHAVSVRDRRERDLAQLLAAEP